MEICPNFSGYIVGRKAAEESVIIRLRCKMWSCEYCASANASKWRGHLLNSVKDKGLCNLPNWYMMTLTSSGDNRTAQGSASALQEGWNSVLQNYRNQAKRFGQKISYIRVFEAHKDGAIHLHAIINNFAMGGAWYKSKWSSRRKENVDLELIRLKDITASKNGMGWNSQVKRVRHDEQTQDEGVAILYVCKYLTKSAQAFFLPKGARRIATSRNLALRDYTKKSDFEWKQYSNFTEKDLFYVVKGTLGLYSPQAKKYITCDDFDQHGELEIR